MSVSKRIVRVFFSFSVILLCAGGARAQDDSRPTLRERLEAARNANDVDFASLIKANRLQIKPIVNGLVSESIMASLKGDASTADTTRALATRIAETFAYVFKEKSLTEAVSYLERWTEEERRAKLRADSLLGRARQLRSGGEALQVYESALEIFQRIGDRNSVAETLGGLGVVHWYRGAGDSTLAYFEQALSARKDVDDRQLVGNSLNDIGSSLIYFNRDYKEALTWYLQAAAVRESIGDSAALARSYDVIATAYQQLGKRDSALVFYRKAVTLNRQVGNTALRAEGIVDVATVLMEMGRSSEALAAVEEGIELLRTLGDKERLGMALNWKGAAYRRVGDFESALDAYREVIRLARERDDQLQVAYGQFNIGILLEYAGRYEQAVERLVQALSAFEALSDNKGVFLATTGLANSYLFLQEYDRAKMYAKRALEVSRELNDRSNETRSLITLGNVQVLSGEEEEALRNFSKALEAARSLGSPDLIWTALLGHGDYYDRIGEYERAIEYYEKGIGTVESVRGSLYSDEEKAGFLSQKRFAYEHIVHMLGKLHKEQPEAGFDKRAFRIAERSKARSFLDMLAESVANIHEDVDPQLLNRQSRLVAEIGNIQQQMQKAAAGESADSKVFSLREQLSKLEEEYRSLRREIRLNNPSYAQLQHPEPATISEVQSNLLEPGTVLLQYALGDSSSALWAVTRNASSFHVLPDRNALQEKVELIRFALERPDAPSRNMYSAAAHELYEILLAPAGSLVNSAEHLIIIPDGALHFLPFEALLTDAVDKPEIDYSGLPYLIRSYAVTYGPSASVLIQLRTESRRSNQGPQKDLLAFGDPVFDSAADQHSPDLSDKGAPTQTGLERLPYSGTEVRGIASLFSAGRVDAFLRENAVEERVKGKTVLTGYKYIHFATHGLIDEKKPDFSSIVLTQDDDSSEDGFLQAAEIFNLEMNPDLVVLSACETGLGKMVRGEGLVGLTRAFMYAGAPSVVVSLWRVADESTSHLMQGLYARLAVENAEKADALRDAKLHLLAQNEFSHPFHWAPFVMVGDWN